MGLYKLLKSLSRNPLRCHFFFSHLLIPSSQQRACVCGSFLTNNQRVSSGDGALLPCIRGELLPPRREQRTRVVTVIMRSLRMQFCPSSVRAKTSGQYSLRCDANYVGPGFYFLTSKFGEVYCLFFTLFSHCCCKLFSEHFKSRYGCFTRHLAGSRFFQSAGWFRFCLFSPLKNKILHPKLFLALHTGWVLEYHSSSSVKELKVWVCF